MLSGNRNFEGRINPDVKMNFLASPPLVVAYALAGTMDIDLLDDPLGQDSDGEDVYLKDIWPSAEEVARVVEASVHAEMFRSSYDDVFDGDERWQGLEVPEGDRFAWDERSTYVRRPSFLEDIPKEPVDAGGHRGRARAGQARRLASRPTTSRPPARSRRARRRRSTSTRTASSRGTSTPTARAAATTR